MIIVGKRTKLTEVIHNIHIIHVDNLLMTLWIKNDVFLTPTLLTAAVNSVNRVIHTRFADISAVCGGFSHIHIP